QRISLERLMGEQAAQVRMTFHLHPEHLVDLALEPINALPDRDQGGKNRIVLAQRHLETQPRGAGERVEMVDRLEALLAVREVDAAEVEHEIEPRGGVLLELAGDVRQ